MSTVQCLSCASLNLQAHPKHAAQGFGRCPHDPVEVFVNVKLQRECKKFKPGAAEIIAARIEWAKKL